MGTANSMNCLTEAIGMALPGNGTLVATHEDRKSLFVRAAHQIVAMAKAYYGDGDSSILPNSICNKAGLENAARMMMAIGGSTNTILHLLAVLQIKAESVMTIGYHFLNNNYKNPLKNSELRYAKNDYNNQTNPIT